MFCKSVELRKHLVEGHIVQGFQSCSPRSLMTALSLPLHGIFLCYT